MTRKLIVFLKLLEQEIPPPSKCHHSISYFKYGPFIEDPGPKFQDKLGLQLNINGTFIIFFLDDSDFEKPAEELVDILKIELDYLESSSKV